MTKKPTRMLPTPLAKSEDHTSIGRALMSTRAMGLPRVIRRPELRLIAPIADSSIYEMEQRGELPVPTQIVWPDTWDDAAKIPRKVKRDSNRQTQVKATRAWNLLNALFYKAGKVPWRLLPDQAEYRTSFLGIGFYRDLDGQQLWTSTAQMFDERGRGLILRGARAQTETRGRHPYLTAKDAEELVAQSIAAYKAHHRHVPARLVVLKTSRFRPEEAEGIDAALGKSGIEMSDLVWVQESSPIAIFRDGNYPVLRGTFVDLGDKGLLCVAGRRRGRSYSTRRPAAS